MNPSDVQLIEQIQQITQGGSRVLVTLARRGKALERDEPERAAFLLAAVGTHPLYKGGRLTFDMLEVEDLMLDGSPVDSMSTRELIRVLDAGGQRLGEALRQMGSAAQGGPMPREASAGDNGAFDGDPLRPPAQMADEPAAAKVLPRVSLGPVDDVALTSNGFAARGGDWDTRDNEPELRSSDYLYDYVVLGLLELVGGMRVRF